MPAVVWRNPRIVTDAANPRNRRITSDDDAHICKVYGYSEEEAQAKAEIILAAIEMAVWPLPPLTEAELMARTAAAQAEVNAAVIG